MITASGVGSIAFEMMWVIVKIAGPVLVAALIVGVIISLIQALTQVQEQTLTFLPKIAVIIGVIFLLGGNFYRMIAQLTERTWGLISSG